VKGWGTVNEIKVMLGESRSVSEVARELGIDRKTVRKYGTMPMEEVAEYRRHSKERTQKLDRYRRWIEQRVEEMALDGVINAQAIYEQLKRLGYSGSARSVRRLVSGLRPKALKKRIYQPFETPAGYQGMVDLTEKRGVRMGARKQTVYGAVMILSHSRKKYVEWYDRPIDTQLFLEFHQRAFLAFDGIPQQIVYDQTKLAVIRERYGEVEFNESFYGFSQWWGYRPYICRKFDPETKGKVEAAIRYLKRSFLPGRSFRDVGDLDQQCGDWLKTVANAKPHETTGRPPDEVWKEERVHLKPLVVEPFQTRPAFRRQQVGRDGLVKVLGNRYSVPSGSHGEEVQVRISEEKVEIRSLEGTHLWSHWRALGRGRCVKLDAHYRKVYAVPTEALTRQLLEELESPDWVAELRRRFPRHYREQCRQILALAPTVEAEILREAARRVLRHGCVSYGNLKKTVRYLESVNHLSEAAEQRRQRALELPEDLGVEIRSADYYDQAALEVDA
jgi:transposase